MRYLLPICFALAVAACETLDALDSYLERSYEEDKSAGLVLATQLNTNIYEINIYGNGYHYSRKMRNFALLRTTEVCLDNGFASFVPVVSYATISDVGQTSITIIREDRGLTTNIVTPNHNMIVQMFKDEERVPPTVFSCQMIYDNLASQYLQSQPSKHDGGAVIQLNTNIYVIKAKGKNSETRENVASLQAAETCIDKGFAFLVPIARDTSKFTTEIKTVIYHADDDRTTRTRKETRREHDMLVKMFKAEESAPSPTFSCQAIYDNLAPRYKQN